MPSREYPSDATDAPGERVTRVRGPGNHINRALRSTALAAIALGLATVLPQSSGEAEGAAGNGADATAFLLQAAALPATPRSTSSSRGLDAQRDVSCASAEAASTHPSPAPDCGVASSEPSAVRTRGTPNSSSASRALATSSSSTPACSNSALLAALVPAFSLEPRDPLVVDSRASAVIFGNRTKLAVPPVATAFDVREAAEYAGEVTKSVVRHTQISPLSEPAFRARIAHRMTHKMRPS
jgi:hypothetical protein